jgi:hypothetical protein
LARVAVKAISTATGDTVLLTGVSVYSDLAVAQALLAIEEEMSDSLGMFVRLEAPFNHQRRNPKGNANVRSWENLRIDGVAISARDVEFSAASLRVSPGQIGPFKTALFQEISALDLRLTFRTGETPRQVYARHAQWQFPIGQVWLRDGHVSGENERTTAFRRCAIAPQSWTISHLSHARSDARWDQISTAALGLRSKVFSWDESAGPVVATSELPLSTKR